MRLRTVNYLSVLLLTVCTATVQASVIGTNVPSASLTRERIAALPKADQQPWIEYLERSQKQKLADKAALAAEMKSAGLQTPLTPPQGGHSAHSIPLHREDRWYSSDEAHHIADVIVSFQTPTGGWSKNLDMSHTLRRPGMAYGLDNLSPIATKADFDQPEEPQWNYIATIDNDATTTQLVFLAKVIAHGGAKKEWAEAFRHGIEYLLAAQYPNGGWPQVWPLQGGYHDDITYNDDAMTQVVDLLYQLSIGQGDYSFADAALRARSAAAFEKGIVCILATQIVANNELTVWPQQDDALTLQPASARNYELPVPCAAESARILILLMNDLPHPTAQQQKAIRAAAAWLNKTALYGYRWTRTPDGRQLVKQTGAGPIWPRYMLSGSNQPVFGDRDKSIHDAVNEISEERRNGYAWFGDAPQEALERFAQWSKEHK